VEKEKRNTGSTPPETTIKEEKRAKDFSYGT
jgi:hypothetical protein